MWVWQQNKWPNFEYSKSLNGKNECKLEFDTGVFIGLIKSVNDEDKKSFIIDIISNEALKTSEIEGEKLNRDSLQSSIMNFFGINKTPFRKQPAEYGIAEMMTDLYNDYKKQLDNKTLCNWHSMLMNGRRDINIGKYRYLDEPMQIISGRIGDSRVYYEAPPSSQIEEEMKRFIKWFNESSPEGKNPISPLIRASICHLYFEMIHPFEDGNGRIGRALVQKIIAQHFDYPVFIALSNTINNRKKEYYNAFEINNNSLLIDRWIDFFSSIILESIQYTSKEIEFIIEKGKFFIKYEDLLNARQKKVIMRIFTEGSNGFKGGLSAENYVSITKTSRSTATRDLNDLIKKGIMHSSGMLKSTRYFIGNVK
jgi:Fic family protein